MRTFSGLGVPAGVLLLGGACDYMIDQGGGHAPEEVPDLDPCEVAVTVSPDQAWVLPYGLVQLRAEGGLDGYAFSVEGGGTVNPVSGAYIAGPDPGADVVTATAIGCAGAASAAVEVVHPLQVRPTRTELLPGTTVTLSVTNGSGAASCTLAADQSGASVAWCAYTAGSGEGVDVVRVTDDHTGEFVDASFVVDASARLSVAGHGRIFVPLGSSFAPEAVGGSGWATAAPGGSVLALDDGLLTGASPGRTTLTLTDDFTGASVTTSVDVVAPVTVDIAADGERTGHGVALPLGDVNGDGYADAAFGFIEISLDAWQSGGVLVYAGGPGGLNPEPVRIISGDSPSSTWGRSLAVGDVNGDGRPDLLVGADQTDRNGTNTGSVRVYAGVAGGFFEAEASNVVYGELIYGRLGSSMALCDFDADGFADLAVGAIDHYDPTAPVPAIDQGSVYVWRGGPGGLSATSDFKLHGPHAGMHLGDAMAAGDLDGDGLCDLAVGASGADFDGGSGDGLVVVYRGTTDQGLLLTRQPVRVYAADDGDAGQFGRRIAAGDLDGDGKAELIVSQWRSDAGGASSGQVHLFPGGPLDGPADEPVAPDEARWTLTGASGSSLGSDVQLAHMDADGVLDLVVGAYLGRLATGGASSQGLTLVFSGADVMGDSALGPFDAVVGDASRVVAGPSANARLGQAAAGIGDASGDGVPDLLVLAGYDGTYGVEAGATYFASGSDGTLTLLELPNVSSGHEFGRGATLFDVDGDGVRELIAGAPGAGDPAEGANSGMVFAFEPDGSGWDVGGPILGGHANHGATDQFGYRVAPAGDFDGDGHADLAVLARKDSKPATFGISYANPAECPGSVSLAGAVFVYRGGSAGLAAEPSFVVYGPSASDYLFEVAGGFDHDGDGYDDLVIGSLETDGVGGFAVVRGRPAPAEDIEVVCDADRYEGFKVFDRLGVAVTGAGDIDQDGCDEIAVGASGEEFDSDWFNQGSVRLLWGYGPSCASLQAEVTALAVKVPGTEVGGSLAGGQDVDGDGVPDLVVGADAYRRDFAEVGAAWLVPGSYLAGLPREDLPSGALPPQDTWQWEFLVPDDGLDGDHGLVGTAAGGLFGRASALVGDPTRPGRAMVAVAAPRGDVGGSALGGGFVVHRYVGLGLEAVPYAVLIGESFAAGDLGATLRSEVVDGVPVLLVGAPDSSAEGLATGAVYTLSFDGLP